MSNRFPDSEQDADKRTIVALVDRWRVATKAKDLDVILALLADDAVFLPSTLPPLRGRDEVAKMYRDFFPRYREIQQEGSIEEVRVAGDWAFFWGTDELHLTPESGENKIHMRGKGLGILKREPDGSWRFWRGINNMTHRPIPE